jgi:hypothetical protein
MGNVSKLPQVMGDLKNGELVLSENDFNLSSLVRLLFEVLYFNITLVKKTA